MSISPEGWKDKDNYKDNIKTLGFRNVEDKIR